jgi:hypothetical protein
LRFALAPLQAAAGAVLVGTLDHSRVQGWSSADVLALLRTAAADPASTALNSLGDAAAVQRAAEAGLLPSIVATDQTVAGIWHEFDTGDDLEAQPASRANGQSSTQQASQQEQQQNAAGPAGGQAAGPRAGEASYDGIVRWKPLLWFKFHTMEEATTFVQQHRHLIDQHSAHLTVRHHGPPPNRRAHVAAAPGEAPVPAPANQAAGPAAAAVEVGQPWPLAQQQEQQQQQQQQAVAVGVPVAWQPAQDGAAPAAGVPLQHGIAAQWDGMMAANPAALPGQQAGPIAAAFAHLDSDDEFEEDSDGSGASQAWLRFAVIPMCSNVLVLFTTGSPTDSRLCRLPCRRQCIRRRGCAGCPGSVGSALGAGRVWRRPAGAAVQQAFWGTLPGLDVCGVLSIMMWGCNKVLLKADQWYAQAGRLVLPVL